MPAIQTPDPAKRRRPERERSAVVIDPKGDLVESILERLPEGVEERTCLIDPDDPDFAVGLDLLSERRAMEDHRIENPAVLDNQVKRFPAV